MGKKGSHNFAFNNQAFVPDSEKPEFNKEVSTSTSEKPTFVHGHGIKDPEAGTVGERGQWSNQLEFLLSCVSMSVGLGNIWRFPVTAYENGGGAFLIPYLIVLIFVGRPIYFLELCLGQFCSQSQVKVWRCNPFFKGVGYASMIATVTVMSYYCSIMALTVFYFFASFAKTLPWAECNLKWADNETCSSLDNELSNETSYAELYFVKEVLKEKANIDDGIGFPEWRLTLCLLASWLVVYFSLIKGVKSSGKVAYFTALFPYVVLITLLIRGVTLDGAWEGIKEFLTPKWEELYNPEVWYAAVSQCFFSLNTGFGSVIMFASYNPLRHNIYRDAMILSFMDTFTSLIAGITVFSVLGYLSKQTGLPVTEILGSGGTGIAFISYPTAIANFPVPQLFAVLFFLMLFTLGIGSATADAGAVITLFADQFPNVKRWIITTILCGSAFLVGLVYVTPGGQYILDLVDYFGAAFVIFLTSVLEVMGIMWIYGMNNFISDIEFMLKRKVGIYWKICWGFIIPVGLSVILVYSLIVAKTLTRNDTAYPTSAIISGWLLAVLCLLPLPVCAILAYRKSSGSTFMERLKGACSPTESWGPADPKERAAWIEFKRQNNRT